MVYGTVCLYLDLLGIRPACGGGVVCMLGVYWVSCSHCASAALLSDGSVWCVT